MCKTNCSSDGFPILPTLLHAINYNIDKTIYLAKPKLTDVIFPFEVDTFVIDSYVNVRFTIVSFEMLDVEYNSAEHGCVLQVKRTFSNMFFSSCINRYFGILVNVSCVLSFDIKSSFYSGSVKGNVIWSKMTHGVANAVTYKVMPR